MSEEEKNAEQASEAEIAASFEGNAPGVNRFVATLGPTGLRLAFLEQTPLGATHFRAAVTMSPQDGLSLRDQLHTMLAVIEDRLKAEDQNASREQDGESI